jgi:predicted 2-oxoglutarate/Fe(II)-dependent dioxygenase YbiX
MVVMFAPELLQNRGIFFERHFFSPVDCGRLLAEMKGAPARKGRIDTGAAEGALIESERKVFCPDVHGTTRDLVVARLLDIRPRLEAHFQVRLADIVSPNFLLYNEGAFYGPHADRSDRSTGTVRNREVSVVIFLNGSSDEPAPDRFGGGALTFYGLIPGEQWKECGLPLAAEPGLLVAFRSDTVHEVQPITHGLRCSIASWYLRATGA